ncbi:hypothetical protein B0H14DRAFT_2913672 [Mycena olivaceomarginata]|nr:hypothetical protein B0H14DRAFT_2913672 [Mycena olivaceomarginata]
MLFLAYSNETTAEADLYYIKRLLPGTLNVMKTALYVATTLVSDAFMFIVCFVVWNYSIPIIVFPTLCLLAGIGTGITGLIGFSNVVSAFFGMTMATNGIATGGRPFTITTTSSIIGSTGPQHLAFRTMKRKADEQ